jgi:hypothetical protein
VPDRIPGFETIFFTIGFYLFIILLLRYKSPCINNTEFDFTPHFTLKDLWTGLLLFMTLSILWLYVIPILLVLGILAHLGMIFLGPLSLITALLTVLQSRLSLKR